MLELLPDKIDRSLFLKYPYRTEYVKTLKTLGRKAMDERLEHGADSIGYKNKTNELSMFIDLERQAIGVP